MRVDNSTEKGTSGMDKFGKVHRVHMELGGKLLNSLRIETQFFERLQSVGVVDGAAHTQKDDVESNGGSLMFTHVQDKASLKKGRLEQDPLLGPSSSSGQFREDSDLQISSSSVPDTLPLSSVPI
jgi:hypothetical protein